MSRELTELLGRFTAGLSGRCERLPQGNNYELILRHGRDYQARPLPRKYQRMTPQQCFRNCQQMLWENPRLRYVEGYALAPGGIPVLHAWCVTAGSDRVIEPTCGDFTEYRGIALRRAAVRRNLSLPGRCLSVLDNWENRWPLLMMTDDQLARVVYSGRSQRTKGLCS